MPLESRVPKDRWVVVSTVDTNGTINFSVVFNDGFMGDKSVTKVSVKHGFWPWTRKSFPKRVRRGLEKAQKIAWQHNQDLQKSKQIEYDLTVATKKTNPHDDL